MSKQKNKGPSERELVISRIKNLMIGSAVAAGCMLLGIWSHIDFVTIPALGSSPGPCPVFSPICCSCAGSNNLF